MNEGRVCHAAVLAGPEVGAVARARAERTPQLPDLSSLGMTIDQKPYLGAPLLGGDQCIGHGLVVEGIGHDPDDGAGWNVVYRANDLVHESCLLTSRSIRIIEGRTGRRHVHLGLRRRHHHHTQGQDHERDERADEFFHEEANPRVQ